jgi:hypothetical protein
MMDSYDCPCMGSLAGHGVSMAMDFGCFRFIFSEALKEFLVVYLVGFDGKLSV